MKPKFNLKSEEQISTRAGPASLVLMPRLLHCRTINNAALCKNGSRQNVTH